MIRALIISDSHGYMENVEKVLEREGSLDMVIHLGDITGQEEKLRAMCDCPVKIVRGNCDFNSENELVEVFSLNKNKILATHGHHYSVDWGLDKLYYAAQERGCNIAMYGHTHIPDISYQGSMIMVNPGSISRPRQLNHKPTYGLMTIDEDGKTDITIKYV